MSSETHFTPGPWQHDVCITIAGQDHLPCVVDEHRLLIAQIWDDGHSELECEANAHLIAAAPDLYAVLVGARETILSLKNARWSEAEGSDADWVGDIDETLAKAQGGGQSSRD